ncbi:MAG: DUF6503 family protein [Bacteroidota bacterium]
MNRLILAGFFLILTACAASVDTDPQSLVDQSIKSHGFDRLTNKSISFKFRKKTYSVARKADGYIYKRVFTDSLGTIVDELKNSSELVRKVNGSTTSLNEKEVKIATEAVNSVLYFFQLPYGLNDAAVNKQYAGEDEISGVKYHLVSVTFKQEGGGTDFQDEYMYWINQSDNTIDYLAYNYIVNEGGVRFRKAINRKTVDGLVFQDYINYKPADKKTPLKELSKLYQENKLIELSRIIAEDISISGIR